MEGCCTDLRKQKFAANGPVCSNPLGSIQLDVYALATGAISGSRLVLFGAFFSPDSAGFGLTSVEYSATDPDKKGLCKAVSTQAICRCL